MELSAADLELLEKMVYGIAYRRWNNIPPIGTTFEDIYQDAVLNCLKDTKFDPAKGTKQGRMFFRAMGAFGTAYRTSMDLIRNHSTDDPDVAAYEDTGAIETEAREFLETLSPEDHSILMDPDKFPSPRVKQRRKEIESWVR